MTSEIAEYTWLLRSINDRPFPYVARGNAHLVMGKPLRAVVDYVAALGCDPTLVQVVALKGEALAMMRRYDEALRAFDEALAQRPNDPDALSGRAIVHMACNRMIAADADWRRQLAVLPPERASARACVALRLADYAVARPELDRSLERQPKEPYWYLYRLSAARRIGEPLLVEPPQESSAWPAPLLDLHAGRLSEEAVLHLADNADRQAEAHFQLGILRLHHDPGCSRQHFERVVELSQPSLIEHSASRHELMRWKL
jgi:tetratricopeptide (TPR) repeat protein